MPAKSFMRVRKLEECQEIIAGDGVSLRELLHPDSTSDFGGRYSLAHAVISPGNASKPHSLTTNEVYYILSGEGEMHISSETATVTEGDVIEIQSGQSQWIENSGSSDLIFLCIVDPAWRKEDEEIIGQ